MLKHIYSSRYIDEAVKEECMAFKVSIILVVFLCLFGYLFFQDIYIDTSTLIAMIVMAMFCISILCMLGNAVVRIKELKSIKNERSKYDSKLLATGDISGTVVSIISETCLKIGKHYGTAEEYRDDLYMRYRLKIETAYGDILVTEPFEQMHGKLKDRGEGYSLLGCGDPDVLSYYENTKDNVVGMHCRIYNGYDRCIVKIQDKIFDAY